jgi:molybdate transport system ATP-binding protein
VLSAEDRGGVGGGDVGHLGDVGGGGGLRARLVCHTGTFALDVTLAIPTGTTLVLLGPNGSGKTTSLELLAGLRRLEGGRIALDDVVLADPEAGIDLPPEARHIGYVLQDYALFPQCTVRGNVAYGPRARGLRREARERRVAAALARFGLESLAERHVTALSQGQRQRVALARAWAAEPRLLLLDEPFAALDAATRTAVRAEVRAFLAESALPALVVTHDPLDAFLLGDRLAVIEGGRIVQEGTSEDLLAHPRTPFVAELVGRNVCPAELAAGSGLRLARSGALAFHVLAEGVHGPVDLAFAPSDVALAATAPEGSFQNCFAVRVSEVFGLPDRLRVILETEPGEREAGPTDRGFSARAVPGGGAGAVGERSIGAPARGRTLVADVTRESAAGLGLAPGRTLFALLKATSIQVYARSARPESPDEGTHAPQKEPR